MESEERPPLAELQTGHGYVLLGVTLLAVITIVLVARGAQVLFPALLSSPVALIVLVLTGAARLLILVGLHLFMHGVVRVESIETIVVRPTEAARRESSLRLREYQRRPVLTVFVVGGLVALLLVALLW